MIRECSPCVETWNEIWVNVYSEEQNLAEGSQHRKKARDFSLQLLSNLISLSSPMLC